MKRLLSHVNTKMELTKYLARKMLERGHESGKDVVVMWSNKCQATHKDIAYLESSQLLLHAVDATISGATSIEIFSPDTDVFVLSIRRFPELCENTSFVTGRGHHNRKILLSPIGCAPGPARTAALPAFHAWSGADISGSFAGKGKLACWKVFLEADKDSVDALADLGTTARPTARAITVNEKLVCQLYQPKTLVSCVKDLRWLLFRNKQAQSERLPPMQAALKEGHIVSSLQNEDLEQ